MAFELLQYMTSAFAAYAVVLQTIWPVFTQRQCTQTYKDQEGGGGTAICTVQYNPQAANSEEEPSFLF